MELAPGLHRIGSDPVNSYVVATDAGLTIVDAGLPGDFRHLQAELDAMGRSLDEVRGVVLTHGDTDHIGYAERLRRDHGVPIHVHELDAARARGEGKQPNGSWRPLRLGPTLSFLWYAGRRGGLRITPVGEVATFADGEELDLPGRPRIVPLPGHTPGSVAVHVPAVDAVFVGDAMTTRNVLTGRPGAQPAPFTLDPDLALSSLRRLDEVAATWVLPGHGPPFGRGVPAALAEVRANASGSADRQR